MLICFVGNHCFDVGAEKRRALYFSKRLLSRKVGSDSLPYYNSIKFCKIVGAAFSLLEDISLGMKYGEVRRIINNNKTFFPKDFIGFFCLSLL